MKVIKVDSESVVFEDGTSIYSDHQYNCCETHSLDFSNLSIEDFEGYEFDLSSDAFFEKVEDYGIRLIPINGHPISVPGYGHNNGYYSTDLSLVIKFSDGTQKKYDITKCQYIDW
jgi:hypothetical protein